MTDPTDELVEQARRGDRAAMETLCEKYRPRLVEMVRRRLNPRLRPRLDASDVVQETLLLAARDLGSYELQRGVPFYAWLRQIAWRQLLRASEQHIDAAKRTVLLEQGLAWDDTHLALFAQLTDQSTPSMHVARQELVAKLSAALTKLEDKDRELLALRFLEGLPAAEAAAVMGVSESTLRRRLTQALEQLSWYLEGGDHGDDSESRRGAGRSGQ